MGESRVEKVLIVDDEEAVRVLLSRYFEQMGHRPLTAQSGAEAIEIFQTHADTGDIAGVILDLSMPGMSGEEVFDSLVKIDPKVKVILTSGYTENDSLARFGGRNIMGFIQKPFRPLELVTKARDVFCLTLSDSAR